MSHLACAERQGHPMNRRSSPLRGGAARLPAAPASLANSSGIFLGRDFHFDLARPGAALYGLAPVGGRRAQPDAAGGAPARADRADPRHRGRARVGYGATWAPAAQPARIATVAVGYADGFLRSLGNRATAFAGDTPVPLVGIVSMDTATFDVTDAPRRSRAASSS